MVCIYCQSATQVVNSRHQKQANQVWRRRRCTACMAVFSTHEAVDGSQALRVNHNGHYAPFSRDKLLISIYKSLLHRPNAVSDASALTNTIWGKLQHLVVDASLLPEHITAVTIDVLEHFDKAAAVHYRSFHASSV